MPTHATRIYAGDGTVARAEGTVYRGPGGRRSMREELEWEGGKGQGASVEEV